MHFRNGLIIDDKNQGLESYFGYYAITLNNKLGLGLKSDGFFEVRLVRIW